MTLTNARLRELLDYDPETGVFVWRVKRRGGRNGRITPGTIAGTLDKDGYRIIRVDHRTYRAARLAYFYVCGMWPPFEIDHINRDRADDRWMNLRDVTRQENCVNRSGRKHSKTGVKGVHCAGKRFTAAICVNYRQFHLGTFDTIEEAQAAYAEASAI